MLKKTIAFLTVLLLLSSCSVAKIESEKVVLAVADQAEKWMNEDKNYRVAVETGNIAEAGRIGNMYTEQAKESVYAAMVYA